VSSAAEKEVQSLSADLRARLAQIGDLIAETGPEHLPQQYVKHVKGKLWELRLKGRDNIARSIYVTTTGDSVVILLTIVKKTQKLPKQALDTAEKRAKEAGLI